MRAGISVMAAAVLLVGAASCQTASHLPDEYLGQWYHQETSGGIQGETIEENAPGWIVITTDNEIQRYAADGGLASTETFVLSRGPTIYSAGDGWILDPSPPTASNADLGVGLAIWLHAGTLTIADNVYDGFGSSYTRDP